MRNRIRQSTSLADVLSEASVESRASSEKSCLVSTMTLRTIRTMIFERSWLSFAAPNGVKGLSAAIWNKYASCHFLETD